MLKNKRKHSKYIHLASFAGNIGDVVNHVGFYDSLGIDESQVQQIEIRRFYKNCDENQRLSFDNHLIEKINASEMLILGGGGFFDVYWDDSSTGTTLDITRAFIDSIKVPVLVNAMGVHFDRSRKKGIDNFFQFLNYIKKRENWLITIRNDGSMKRLRSVYGDEITKGIQVVPDNGFMVQEKEKDICHNYYTERKIIGLSITNEMLNIEWGGVTLEQFNLEIGTLIENMLKCYCCVFFLHGPQDFSTLIHIQKVIGKERFRNNVIVAPYLPFGGRSGMEEYLKYYNICDVIIGMRFHASVISIANNIPVVGLAIHEQISDLYEEVQFKNNCVRVGENEYINKLKFLLDLQMYKSDECKRMESQIMHKIILQHNNYVKLIKSFVQF